MKTVINHARIITGTGTVLEDGALSYENGRILEVSDKELKGDREIDGHKMTVIPGLIDAHVHLGMELPGGVAGQWPGNLTELGARIYYQCKKLPRFGITTVRNMGTDAAGDIVIRNLINENRLPMVRIVASGEAISITGGHGNPAIGCDTKEELLVETRRRVKAGADVVKLVATGGMTTAKSIPSVLQYTAEEMKVAVDEAEITGRITGAHCTSLAGAKAAIAAGVRSIEHAQLDEETVQMMVDREKRGREVFFCPTLITRYSIIHNTDPKFQWLRDKAKPGDMERKMSAVRLCHEAGIRICASTDRNAPFAGDEALFEEVALYTRCGLTNGEAIMTATKNAAELCRIDRETGTLEPGKCADFVLLEKNPLEQIENLKSVKATVRDGLVLYGRF